MTRHRAAAALAVLMLGLGVAGCGGDDGDSAADDEASPTPEPVTLAKPFEVCSTALGQRLEAEVGFEVQPVDEVFNIADEDRTVLIGPPGEPIAQPAVNDAVRCMLRATGAPASVEQRLGATNAAAGPQMEIWDLDGTMLKFDWVVTTLPFSDDPTVTASFAVER